MIYDLKNGKTLTVRRAREEDAWEIVCLSDRIGGETDNLTFGINDYYYGEEEERILIRNIRHRNNCLLIVGIVEGRIVGILSFIASHRKRIMHRGDMGIYILKDYWNLGIGSCMIEYFLKWVKEHGAIKKIALEVRTDNERAINLYKKYGFEIEGHLKKSLFIDGKYYDTYYMGKIIEG
ncbi:Protein N-acetyltransferase, RimJ/RimL family [Caloramator quimbayensis]|uniref:Protein N-acetyltransferase, RimJ/RimL family n=1 Tax=Caloramator quimbayensis TaxID=1147123 RepID=A0A1T4WHL1_9CLOT|nr:GNAT family protein [Caloramator quimbayensis]SKA76697.1 Protein N-acetyltransferase, RimJ/RimL family [Caloramator quimbayensis]